MRRLVALLWIGLLLGALLVVPKEAKAEDTNWWVKRVPGTINAVAVSPNGDIIMAGSVGTGSTTGLLFVPKKVELGDAQVLRLDKNGDVKWRKTYGGRGHDAIVAVALTDNGDIIAVGFTDSFGAGNYDFWVLRLDGEGNVKWQKTYGGGDYDMAWSVVLADNGDIIVVGYYGVDDVFPVNHGNAWVLRLDENGNIKWQKIYKTFPISGAIAGAVAPNGDIIVAGTSRSLFGAGWDDAWVVRLDENGNVKWQKTYGGSEDEYANAVAIAPNGNIIVAGRTRSFGAGGWDFWVLRLDENGNVKWQKTYGGSDWEGAYAVAVANNGDIIVGGEYLLALNPEGNLKWAKDTRYVGDIKISPDGTAVFSGLNIGRININQVPEYTGWIWRDVSLEVHDTNAQVSDTNVKVSDSNAEVHNVNAEVHNVNAEVETVWTYTPPKGTLEISSSPSGAKVYVNDDYKGETPLTLELEAGTYDVKLTMEDYEDYTTTVTLEAGETKTLSATLTPKFGYLTVYSTPSGAKVYVDGNYAGETPLTDYKLPTGEHEVRVEKEGYQEYTTSVEVKPGETREVSVELSKVETSSSSPETSTTTTPTSTYTPSNLPEITSTLINTGTIEVPGYQPSKEYLKKTAEYAINKAEELIGKVKDLGYEINFADDYLREAKNAFEAGDYKKAKELALNAWITALLEWQIQYESEILEKAGVDVSQVMKKYNSGDLDGAIELIHSLENELSGDYAEVFDSVDDTFESVKDYWDEGIRLWNYVGDLYASNEKFKADELDVAKNLADKALNVVRDVGEMAREVLRQLKELGDSIFREGRGDEKAKELFERAMELFERGEFEQAKQVVVEIQEVITVTTTKSGGICGPALILGLMIIPILIRRKLM